MNLVVRMRVSKPNRPNRLVQLLHVRTDDKNSTTGGGGQGYANKVDMCLLGGGTPLHGRTRWKTGAGRRWHVE